MLRQWNVHVAASLPLQVLLTLAAATLFSLAVVLTWQRTQSMAAVLAVSTAVLLLLKMVFLKYRKHQHRENAKRYALPYIRYNEGGTNI